MEVDGVNIHLTQLPAADNSNGNNNNNDTRANLEHTLQVLKQNGCDQSIIVSTQAKLDALPTLAPPKPTQALKDVSLLEKCLAEQHDFQELRNSQDMDKISKAQELLQKAQETLAQALSLQEAHKKEHAQHVSDIQSSILKAKAAAPPQMSSVAWASEAPNNQDNNNQQQRMAIEVDPNFDILHKDLCTFMEKAGAPEHIKKHVIGITSLANLGFTTQQQQQQQQQPQTAPLPAAPAPAASASPGTSTALAIPVDG